MATAGHHPVSSESGADVDVLVVGAGPTGLVAASESLRRGLSVRIIERRASRGVFSKALVVHARTLEVFDTMGVAPSILRVGAPFSALNANFSGSRASVRVDLLGLPWGDTAYPYWLSVPQCDTERVLESHLRELGGAVEWSWALQTLTDFGDVVEAELQGPGGPETVRARWVIGCDGGRSTVRDQVGITLSRTGEGTTFLLADVKSTSALVEDEGHLHLAPQGLLIIVPMPEPGRWRLIAHVPATVTGVDEGAPVIDAVGLDDIIRERTGIEFGSHDVTWTSQFDLTHGVADRFRAGRVFLAGDAAHIHSPVGGQGLNTGVQDAYNLVWKLAEARDLPPQRAENLLNSYEVERRGTATSMVRGVARMTEILTSRRRLTRWMIGEIAPRLLTVPRVQARLGRSVGMLNLSYSGRSRPRWRFAPGVKVGQRLPNPELVGGGRAFDRLDGTGYSWLVVTDCEADVPGPDDARWRGFPLVLLPRSAMVAPIGSRGKTTVVLVRPDGYIAHVRAEPAGSSSRRPRSRRQ